MADIRETLRKYLIERLELTDGQPALDGETDLQESGILDSFSTLDLISFIETRFNIQLEQEDLDAGHLHSLARMERLVHEKTRPSP